MLAGCPRLFILGFLKFASYFLGVFITAFEKKIKIVSQKVENRNF